MGQIKTMTAIIIGGDGLRYEKDLKQHFTHVAFWNTFPPFRETDAARRAWADRVLDMKSEG